MRPKFRNLCLTNKRQEPLLFFIPTYENNRSPISKICGDGMAPFNEVVK